MAKPARLSAHSMVFYSCTSDISLSTGNHEKIMPSVISFFHCGDLDSVGGGEKEAPDRVRCAFEGADENSALHEP